MRLLAALLFPLLACGALPVVQSAQNGNNSGTKFTTTAVAYGSNTAAGNLLIVACTYYDVGSQTISVTDTNGNIWLSVPQISLNDGSANLSQQVFYAPISKAGASTVTCTFSAAAGFPGLQIAEVVGYSIKDQSISGSGSGTANVASGNVTTLSDPEFIYAVTANEATPPAPTPGSGYAILLSGTIVGLASEYKVQTSKGTQNGTFTASAATPYLSTLVTFKAKGVSPGFIF